MKFSLGDVHSVELLDDGHVQFYRKGDVCLTLQPEQVGKHNINI
jgi:hypothetical protein